MVKLFMLFISLSINLLLRCDFLSIQQTFVVIRFNCVYISDSKAKVAKRQAESEKVTEERRLQTAKAKAAKRQSASVR